MKQISRHAKYHAPDKYIDYTTTQEYRNTYNTVKKIYNYYQRQKQNLRKHIGLWDYLKSKHSIKQHLKK